MITLKNKSIRDLVRKVLELTPEARDDDMLLVALVWEREVINLDNIFWLIRDGEVTHFETIRRTRQKLQEIHEELQGKTRKYRKKKEEPRVRDEERNFESCYPKEKGGQGSLFCD